MTMTDVVMLLTELNIKPQPGPNGVEFKWYFEGLVRHGSSRFRVERGSGIGGRGDAWNLVELPSGQPCGPKVTTRALLKRQILEALADGPRPEVNTEQEAYARWHACGSGIAKTGSIQWFKRRKKTTTKPTKRTGR